MQARERRLLQGEKGQIRGPKMPPNRKINIKTILNYFSNINAREPKLFEPLSKLCMKTMAHKGKPTFIYEEGREPLKRSTPFSICSSKGSIKLGG